MRRITRIALHALLHNRSCRSLVAISCLEICDTKRVSASSRFCFHCLGRSYASPHIPNTTPSYLFPTFGEPISTTVGVSNSMTGMFRSSFCTSISSSCGVVWCGVVWCCVVWCGGSKGEGRREKNEEKKRKENTRDEERFTEGKRSHWRTVDEGKESETGLRWAMRKRQEM